MASTTTIVSVMLLLSLFIMSSTFVSAARQLNETPKVTGDQSANSEKTKVGTESTKAKDEVSLSDKKFFIPIPIPFPFPFPRTKVPGMPGSNLPSFTPPGPEN
ncbi:hypothetical protein POM88_022538 [Heracleum sosnowskyi]|uniref:Transmembrane protein n=1 Tax=Heracleum sosnowskyi TaxID=360622 RepID=A0AAD8IGL3_9APIA|nr:hypothetical protein POM88_022538 [Heracleum sosnowskyi]